MTSLSVRARKALSHLAVRRSFDGILFLVFALALVLANRTAIEARNVEYGDFAANSLLIQEAKAGHLLVGNYSRVGFNHPGPAILDVLAMGEAVFFDLLHWVPSPFSGQLVAVAFYNAFWMILIVRLWRRLAVDPVAAVGGAAVFFVAAALLDARFYSGPWFPHLYFFPFATFLLATARLGMGRSDSVLSLAISLGFLINGHIAFTPITTITLAVTLAANSHEFRKTQEDRVILTIRWWLHHRMAIVTGLLIVVVFLVPLLIETSQRFPAPLADYLLVGKEHHRNDLKPSLRFVAMYWGGLPFLVLPLALAAHVSRTRDNEVESSYVSRMMVAVTIGVSLAMLLYAVFGVDVFGLTYIGYFYCAVPALVSAAGIAVILPSCSSMGSRASVFALSLAIISVAAFKLDRETDYSNYYKADKIESLAVSLAKIAHSGRMVLDFKARSDLFHTWPVVVGIELFDIRQGHGPACIGQNWQILFTVQARCTAGEIERGLHVVVRSTSDVKPSDPPAIVEGMGVSFFETNHP